MNRTTRHTLVAFAATLLLARRWAGCTLPILCRKPGILLPRG